MGWWSTLFSVQDTATKVTEAVINTGDKLFYTDEEKADDRLKMRQFFPTLLEAYAPFKIAQRILAIWFSFLFGICFLIALGITCFNIYLAYVYVPILDKAGKVINPLQKVDLQPLFNIVNTFDIGIIMLAIVSFYFAGGAIESFRRVK